MARCRTFAREQAASYDHKIVMVQRNEERAKEMRRLTHEQEGMEVNDLRTQERKLEAEEKAWQARLLAESEERDRQQKVLEDTDTSLDFLEKLQKRSEVAACQQSPDEGFSKRGSASPKRKRSSSKNISASKRRKRSCSRSNQRFVSRARSVSTSISTQRRKNIERKVSSRSPSRTKARPSRSDSRSKRKARSRSRRRRRSNSRSVSDRRKRDRRRRSRSRHRGESRSGSRRRGSGVGGKHSFEEALRQRLAQREREDTGRMPVARAQSRSGEQAQEKAGHFGTATREFGRRFSTEQ